MASPVEPPPSTMHQFSVYERPNWDQYKTTISELYEREELRDVMRIMKDEFGFKASENQYKKQLAKWGLNKKHVKSAEYKAMLRRKRMREREGKETEFILHGQKVPDRNIVRFEDRMIKSEQIDENDTLSDVPSPQGLAFRTPPPSNFTRHGSAPMLQIPSRLSSTQRSNYAGYDDREPMFHSLSPPINGLSEAQSDSALRNISHSTVFQNIRTGGISTVASLTELQRRTLMIYQMSPGSNGSSITPSIQSMLNSKLGLLILNQTELDAEIRRFGRLPERSEDKSLLDVMVSCSQLHYDEFCTECESFGYHPVLGGCPIHRCLSRILAQYKLGKIPLQKAEMLCRGAIQILLPTHDPPLASLLRVAADIIWISRHNLDDLTKLVEMIQIPTALLSPGRTSYRAIIAHCALILAQSGHTKESALTLKSALGPEYEDLQRTHANFSCQDLNSLALPFGEAIKWLTLGRVRVFEDRGNWSFFDCDAEEEGHKSVEEKGKGKDEGKKKKAWYRERDGSLKREELVVAGIAVRAMVEAEYQHRRIRGPVEAAST